MQALTNIAYKHMNTMRYDKEDLQEALRVLRAGGVIVYPTDTVWGIGCDATNAEAVARIYALKKRADSKSMLVLLDAPGKLQGYVEQVPEMAWDLLECNSEDECRPMTIIYPGAKNLAPNLIAEDGSVGIRITRELFTRTLCELLHHPIVSTSANVSGQPAAAIYDEIAEEVLAGADYVCRYRRDDVTRHAPSSIIKLGIDNQIQIIRP